MDEKKQIRTEPLAENFMKYFRVDFAGSDAQKKQVYRIRYNVYCKEFGYESIEEFPEQLEYDVYDEYSFHCLITHKNTGIAAGCVRLVPAISDIVDDRLPFERYCSDSLDSQRIQRLDLKRQNVCEISRLAVDGAFRKRPGELLTRFGEVTTQISQQEQRTFMMIAIAAFLASTALTELTARTRVFAMMEPFLPRLLKRSGIIFHKVGKDIDYHGIRAPYFIKTQSALDNMRPELLELYQWIKQEIELSYFSEIKTLDNRICI